MWVHAMVAVLSSLMPTAAPSSQKLLAVPFTAVRIDDEFWAKRLEANRATTVPYCFSKCEETGRIDNFAKAGGLMEGEFEGIYYNDSDVYKVIEGASYALVSDPDPRRAEYLDQLIARIASAQQADGYLNTYHTLVEPQGRWSDLRRMHELYCAGHLFEAAVAHYQATNKRTLLEVAIRLADHIESIFGPGRRHDVPGHQEIEIGLVKLYRVTGEERYLDLARFFLDQRGRGEGRELYGAYCQDHLPVVEQHQPVGHAVRAMYLYCGMADVSAFTGDRSYVEALDRLWENQVTTKLYLTGGVGARRHGEAFGDDYELPNASAYNETCAAIGHALWNHRLNLLHGDGRYVDVLERVIYNGFLSGVSLSGDRFFYPNPLASHGSYHRSPWFDTSCCPVNVVRFVPSIGGYLYAADEDGLYVNLYVGSVATIPLPDNVVSLTQETRYPWDGAVRITVTPAHPGTFDVSLRIPGWARGSPVPSDLYTYVDADPEAPVTIAINGARVDQPDPERGYVRLRRTWRRGDVIELSLPMPIRRVRSHERVEANRGRVALERGPIVYCLEAADAGGHVRHLYLPEDAALQAEHRDELLGGVTVIRGTALARRRSENGRIETEPVPIEAVPYHVWDQREPGEMAVWIPTGPGGAEVIPPPTIASTSRPGASHCYQHDTVLALHDQIEPASSTDHTIPRFTWWPHRGGTEWVQYDFDEPKRVSSVEIYWFDDTGIGRCRLPAAWSLLHRREGQWEPIAGATARAARADGYDRITFEAVQTTALRVVVELQDGFSGGILEWRVW